MCIRDRILAASSFNATLVPGGANDSYAAAVRDASLKMGALAATDIVFDDRTAASLGGIPLAANVAGGVSIKGSRDTLDELVRNDVKSDNTPRNAGKLWFAVNYRACGKPAAGTCWGW